ncbi:sigma-54-dependent Fis family transcriptional regulator [candidate division KSB1 bacterium]|nr:sigma-54-dependent Fis family transcriptional regulator [candidate division KSB1 bacterium]
MTKAKILVVEDEPGYAEFLSHYFEEREQICHTVSDGGSALRALESAEYDAVLLDLRLPDRDGVEILRQIKGLHKELPVVMMTAYGFVQTAVQAMKAGAFDYIAKEELSPDLLDLTMTAALEQRELKLENARLRREVAAQYSFDNLVGKSGPMRDVFQRIQRIAPFNSTVLITGESGTGKEVVARLIHLHSKARNMPFVTVNCGAIPETLLESELFGHAKGAFTGALKMKKGLFEEASGGTLLLDEIGEMPLSLQVKLLRVLQEGKLRKLGDVQETTVEVRVIAATSRNLTQAVKDGTFREDLFYRLNIIPIVMPPLRDRSEDVPLLVHHFLRKLSPAGELYDVTPEATQALTNYSWPGNVRELQNIIERAVVLSDGNRITLDSLPVELRINDHEFQVQIPDEQLSIKQTLAELVPRVEQELIQRALRKTNNNRTRAARLLEISHRSLLYKLKEYNCA